MGLFIVLILIAIPVTEIAVFIQVGGAVGVLPTLIIIVITAMAGASLLRQQGLQTLNRIRQSVDQQQFPAAELFDGLCLIIAGAFLLTPGFVTDGVGFLLFLPPVRRLLGAWAIHYATVHGKFTARSATAGGANTFSGHADIIDGDFVDISDEDPYQPDRQISQVETVVHKDKP